MNKPIYKYTDWYEGKVYLETGAVIYNHKIDKPIKACITDFSENDLKKIKLKQKEIFESKSSLKLKDFKDIFKKRYKNSEEKDLLLKREIEDNNKILYLVPIQELHFENRSFTISKDDLAIMRDYINSQIVKGEKYYGFVHSPNFKFQHEKVTNDLVYARVSFDYYNWLVKFQDAINKALSIKINDKASIAKKGGSTKGKLKVKVIALICFYNKQSINRTNCKEWASKYNYHEITSGEGLFQDYVKFSNNERRTKLAGESKVKCCNRLKLIDTAISHLKGKAKEHAQKDYKILEKAINEHFW